jgi:hypothetical protein
MLKNRLAFSLLFSEMAEGRLSLKQYPAPGMAIGVKDAQLTDVSAKIDLVYDFPYSGRRSPQSPVSST